MFLQSLPQQLSYHHTHKLSLLNQSWDHDERNWELFALNHLLFYQNFFPLLHYRAQRWASLSWKTELIQFPNVEDDFDKIDPIFPNQTTSCSAGWLAVLASYCAHINPLLFRVWNTRVLTIEAIQFGAFKLFITMQGFNYLFVFKLHYMNTFQNMSIKHSILQIKIPM